MPIRRLKKRSLTIFRDPRVASPTPSVSFDARAGQNSPYPPITRIPYNQKRRRRTKRADVCRVLRRHTDAQRAPLVPRQSYLIATLTTFRPSPPTQSTIILREYSSPTFEFLFVPNRAETDVIFRHPTTSFFYANTVDGRFLGVQQTGALDTNTRNDHSLLSSRSGANQFFAIRLCDRWKRNFSFFSVRSIRTMFEILEMSKKTVSTISSISIVIH